MLAIGACIVGNVNNSFYIELRPINSSFVHAAMEIINRPLEEFARTGRDPAEAMGAFCDWVNTVSRGATPVFVGFNAAFDWSFVNWYFHTYTDSNPFGFAALDIKSYYMGLVGCDWDKTRSSQIHPKFKATTKHSHNALNDAIEQANMFERMHQAYRPNP